MKSVEITARTVDEAVNQALDELKVPVEQVEIEILEESSKGFLGIIGGKQARIKAYLKQNVRRQTAEKFLKDIIAKMGIKVEVNHVEDENRLTLMLTGQDLGLLIGKRGETLEALQYLTNIVANNHTPNRKKVIIDAEGYWEKREETLIKLAKRLANQVKKTGTEVVLEPMSGLERKIIHTALQDDEAVQTLSEGEDPDRKVVISLRPR